MQKYQIFIIFWIFSFTTAYAQTTSFRSDFSKGNVGALPDGWILHIFQDDQVPGFVLKEDVMGRYLSLTGGGDPMASAYISTTK
ncbi:MAG: hypothetical protein LBE79_01070 [Tannerella sp.]|jgi:hypothetical protein|nr:hypothetical protein [Tannerella sp.]